MSKSKIFIDYIIEKECVGLPELMDLRINGERASAISTFISNGRKYARTKGYEIINISSWEGRRYISTYYAQKITQ